MNSSRTNLLSATRTLLRWGFYIVVGFMLFMAFLLVAAFVADPSRTSITLTGQDAMTPQQKLLATRIALAGALAWLALSLPLLRGLLAIVDSARNGDPFVPENGARLRRIGWLLLAINAVSTMTESMVLHRGITFPPVEPHAVLGVLMVFVIARIFETGSRMREELRSTV